MQNFERKYSLPKSSSLDLTSFRDKISSSRGTNSFDEHFCLRFGILQCMESARIMTFYNSAALVEFSALKIHNQFIRVTNFAVNSISIYSNYENRFYDIYF